VTHVGDIEIELVFRIALRGRTSDLARLLQAMNKADAVVMCLVEKPAPHEEKRQTNMTAIPGGLSG
jgi:hypothetical protein